LDTTCHREAERAQGAIEGGGEGRGRKRSQERLSPSANQEQPPRAESEPSSLPKMSTGGYYDIDAILSEEVRVPCVFALDAVGMGMLDPTTSDEDLSQGAKVWTNAFSFRNTKTHIHAT